MHLLPALEKCNGTCARISAFKRDQSISVYVQGVVEKIMANQPLSSWIRQPASIILIIALAIIGVMFVDQSKKQPELLSPAVSPVDAPAAVPQRQETSTSSTQPMTNPMGGEMPKIVQRLGGSAKPSAPSGSQPGQLTAPDLSSLLGRMEEKVKADPENINNRLLLAQTYNELGLGDKAITEARAATKMQPDHGRARLVLASILSNRNGENELNEAVSLLKGLQGNPDVKQYLVAMYLGDAWIRLGDHKSAVDNWKIALDGMPLSDNRRAKIEKGIADISAGKTGS